MRRPGGRARSCIHGRSRPAHDHDQAGRPRRPPARRSGRVRRPEVGRRSGLACRPPTIGRREAAAAQLWPTALSGCEHGKRARSSGWRTFSDSTTIRSRVLPTIPITSMPGISARTTAGAHPREVETPPNRATEDGIRPVPAGPDRSRPPQGAVSASQSVSLTPVGGPPRFGECRRLTARPPGRPTFGVGPDGRPILGSPLVSVMLGTTSAGQFVINRVNQLRRAGDVVLYTPHFDSRTSSAASGIDVVISGLALPLRPSGTWTGFVSTVRPAEGGWPIDPGTVVVTVPASSTLGTLLPGEPVTLSTTITPGWESIQQAVGGREWIIRDGVVSITPHPPSADEIHARSAIGLTADGRMILATVGGREVGGRAGVLLSELAELMLERGAVSAINLDGGGSSSLAIRRAGTDGPVLVNRPSDGFERPVTNSIQVISSMPTGPLSVLNVQPGSRSVYRNSTIDFKVSGMDAGYNPVPLASGQVSWSLSAPIGTIDADGHFVATDPGTGQVVVTADGVTGTAPITVLADTTAPVAT